MEVGKTYLIKLKMNRDAFKLGEYKILMISDCGRYVKIAYVDNKCLYERYWCEKSDITIIQEIGRI